MGICDQVKNNWFKWMKQRKTFQMRRRKIVEMHESKNSIVYLKNNETTDLPGAVIMF